MGGKKLRPKIKNHPGLFCHWKIHFNNFLRKLQGSHYPRRGGKTVHVRSADALREEMRAGRVFTRSFNPVSIFKNFLFLRLFGDLIVSMPMRCVLDFTPAACQWGGWLPLIACVPAFSLSLQGRPVPICFRTILIEGSQRWLTTYV